jgi:hypothetical protein
VAAAKGDAHFARTICPCKGLGRPTFKIEANRMMGRVIHDESGRGAKEFQTRTIPNQGRGAAMQRIEALRRLFPKLSMRRSVHLASLP